MKPNEVQIQLERLFRTPIEHPDSSKTAPIAISDLFVQIDPAAGEVQLFNDKDEELHRVVIYDWIQEGRTEIPSAMKQELRAAVKRLHAARFFDKDQFVRPFSVALTEEDFTIIEELLFIDDELIQLDSALLENLDEELDNFLAELLPDIK